MESNTVSSENQKSDCPKKPRSGYVCEDEKMLLDITGC
jgi:hypothetical protein